MKKTSKVLGITAIIAVIALNALLMTGCSSPDEDTPPPPIVYIITKSETTFTATKSGTTVGTANQTIQQIIDSIRTDAAGKNVTIQFGDGTTVLDLGTASVELKDITDSTWGEITLTGKITSSVAGSNSTISISYPVSVTSRADIANTNTYYLARAVYSTGTLNITDGTLTNPAGYTVYNYSSAGNGGVTITGGTILSDSGGWPVYNSSSGTITISGGTVSSASSAALYLSGTGKVTVSGTANITSAATSSTSGTIQSSSISSNVTSANVLLEMTGGTVTNTSTTTGNAIYHGNKGTIIFSGGTVSKAGTNGNAIYNNSTGVVTIGAGATITGNTYGVTP